MSDAPKFDLATSEGGRGYLAHLFRTHLKRHDFTQYIRTDLAADFACVMSRFVHTILVSEPVLTANAGEPEPVASVEQITTEQDGIKRFRLSGVIRATAIIAGRVKPGDELITLAAHRAYVAELLARNAELAKELGASE